MTGTHFYKRLQEGDYQVKLNKWEIAPSKTDKIGVHLYMEVQDPNSDAGVRPEDAYLYDFKLWDAIEGLLFVFDFEAESVDEVFNYWLKNPKVIVIAHYERKNGYGVWSF